MSVDETDYLSVLPETPDAEDDALASQPEDEDEIDEDEEEGLDEDPENEPLQFMSREQIDAQIANVAYLVLPSKKGHVCEITMKSGYIHIGGRVYETPHAMDKKQSKKDAYDLAYKKVWDHEVYALADRWAREAHK